MLGVSTNTRRWITVVLILAQRLYRAMYCLHIIGSLHSMCCWTWIHTYMYMYRITVYDDWLLRYGVFSHSGLTANLNICKSDLIYVGDIFLETFLRRTMDPYEPFFLNRFSKKLSRYFGKMPTVVVVTNMRVYGRTDGRTTTQTEGETETDRQASILARTFYKVIGSSLRVYIYGI